MQTLASDTLAVELVAVLAAADSQAPSVLTIQGGLTFPAGPFVMAHRSLQAGLRGWVEAQTHHPLGYLEQLYTFADRGRHADAPDMRTISISYLGLTLAGDAPADLDASWRSWYEYFPWEDRRDDSNALLLADIATRLRAWARSQPRGLRERQWQRCCALFGLENDIWDEERTLPRYELLYEASLVPESPTAGTDLLPGRSMLYDHRRILATAMTRLRAKLKYRPVIYELMPASFSLLQLQQAVEALAGRRLHKQNFRRLIAQQDLVEETGASTQTGGRPAKLYRFRRGVQMERALATGGRLPLMKS
ncbi:NUDIX hydrolase [Kerstersia gyiorum]|jgi:hypothetical protein|uniref:Membrane protein n=1 Tax=Kerstersia gyiorum TaxID=206506 RepID=A0A171KNS4_9BURK|nr:hypothetical protein [Kerstersia gyiorum]AZV94170.1 hypothetical protein CBF45_10900 [Bordetella sp. J329]MCO7640590.1 hypothetical protein [Pseudomonas sp. S 311-6]KAB0541726.1 hypothetical protein F7P85_16270 [Kerstersia gyiorum]KKO70541.1 membrane protein [Kerstersia gyiorum]MCH4270719.1 hypothetical protein [Kerstersia gyiorum]